MVRELASREHTDPRSGGRFRTNRHTIDRCQGLAHGGFGTGAQAPRVPVHAARSECWKLAVALPQRPAAGRQRILRPAGWRRPHSVA